MALLRLGNRVDLLSHLRYNRVASMAEAAIDFPDACQALESDPVRRIHGLPSLRRGTASGKLGRPCIPHRGADLPGTMMEG